MPVSFNALGENSLERNKLLGRNLRKYGRLFKIMRCLNVTVVQLIFFMCWYSLYKSDAHLSMLVRKSTLQFCHNNLNTAWSKWPMSKCFLAQAPAVIHNEAIKVLLLNLDLKCSEDSQHSWISECLLSH